MANEEIIHFMRKYTEMNGNAFEAALAYERNCRDKYDFPDMRPSLPPKKGERLGNYAMMFGTTVKEMKACEYQVEHYLGLYDINNTQNHERKNP